MRALLLTFALLGSAHAQFPDLPEDHWAQEAVAELVDQGVLIGYPDGTFGGARPVTRFELALIVARLRGLEGQPAAQQALALLDETAARLEALEVRVTDAEANVPSVLLLFDELQRSLETLEGGFSRGLLAQQENVLAETDARLAELDAALREATATFTDRRLGQYDAQVQARLGELHAQVETLQGEWQAAQVALQEEARADWTVDLTGYVGVEGESPLLGGALSASSGAASLSAQGFTGASSELAVQGRYSFGGALAVKGTYLAIDQSASASVGVDAFLLPPVGLELDAGYGSGLTFGGALYHDPRHPAAVIPGLDLRLAGQLGGREGSLQDSLVHVHARSDLDLGGVTLSPGALYRRVQSAGGYVGFVGEVGLGAVLGEVDVTGRFRYGRFDPLGEGDARAAPEAALSVRTGALEVVASLDAGLPPVTAYPRTNDAAPLARDGLVLGLRTGYSITLEGD